MATKEKMAFGGAMPMRGRAPAARMADPQMAMSRSRTPSPMRPPMAAPMAAPMEAPMRPQMGAPAMKEGGKSDMAQDKAMIKKAFKQHDSQEHEGDKGTSLKLKRGGMHKMPDGKMMKDSAMKKGGKATGGVMTPGYKGGGHVKYSTTCGNGESGHTMQNKKIAKEGYGHSEIDCNPMKSGGAATKISTQMKKGGACNY